MATMAHPSRTGRFRITAIPISLFTFLFLAPIITGNVYLFGRAIPASRQEEHDTHANHIRSTYNWLHSRSTDDDMHDLWHRELKRSETNIDLPPGVTIPDDWTPSPPVPPPEYMVDNQNNYFETAPDKFDPAIVEFETRTTTTIAEVQAKHGNNESDPVERRQSGSSYWLANMPHGTWPYAGSEYPAWRNVRDYGAVGDGVTDDTDAIMSAVTDGDRCGLDCGSTTTKGAIVFFPAGTYMISRPIIQYYFTQFIGDPSSSAKPVIKGLAEFEGIALIDVDPYIPGGNGDQWYINQNQFFRQIRNLRLDVTDMPNENESGDQTYVPTCLHWQVAQATSLQDMEFIMPLGGGTTAVGIFTENGSGGFMSDLFFYGGNIAMRVGSQQFTARRITIIHPAIAVSMIWNWGWTWQDITVRGAWVAFECTNFGGDGAQGTGSITILDSHFDSVPYAITVLGQPRAAITIENLFIEGFTESVVLVSGGETLLPGVTSGSATIGSWAMGRRYEGISGTGTYQIGPINPRPNKPAGLLNSQGKFFTRSKPQYQNLGAGSFVSVTDFGAVGDGNGDQAAAINAALAGAAGRIVYFPSGVYLVGSTIQVPVGSRIVGAHWPQIMGFGDFFNDPDDPKPVWRVGNPGDVGDVEISDMIFNTRAPAAGAVVVEWNVRAASQGSAAMWDSHVRIGGSVGSNMQAHECPWGTDVRTDCYAGAMMMHVTPGASGYFENNWLWTADHDLDIVEQTRINIFVARGLLVETTEPCWFWGGASEHAVLYQYNFVNASNILLAHIQTESPYFQPTPNALQVFYPGTYPSDPTFPDCSFGNPLCLLSWGVMIQHSRDIMIWGAGLYSWFQSYTQDCLIPEACQQRMVMTDYSEGLSLMSLYTKATVEVVSPRGGIPPTLHSDNRNGFLTAISAWLTLSEEGGDIGGVQPIGRNPSPSNVLPMPDLASACGNIPPLGTMTLTPNCASAIAALPTSGANNVPPGPDNCLELCNIYRKVTGTCCGTGGSAGFVIEVPPGQDMPAPYPLPSDFTPTATIEVPRYNPTGTTTVTIGPGTPIPTPTGYPGDDDGDDDDDDDWPIIIPIPIGWPFVPIGGPPFIPIPPPVPLGDDDEQNLIIILQTFDANSWDTPGTVRPDPDIPPEDPGAPDGGDDDDDDDPPPFDVIIPDGNGVNCHTDVLYTNLAECYSQGMGGFQTGVWYDHTDVTCVTQGGVFIPLKKTKRDAGGDHHDEEDKISSNNTATTTITTGITLQKRETRIAGYCTLYRHNGCSLVLSYMELPLGGPVFWFHGTGLSHFLEDAQSTCGNGPASVVGLTSRDPDAEPDGRAYAFCLVREGQENGCGRMLGPW